MLRLPFTYSSFNFRAITFCLRINRPFLVCHFTVCTVVLIRFIICMVKKCKTSSCPVSTCSILIYVVSFCTIPVHATTFCSTAFCTITIQALMTFLCFQWYAIFLFFYLFFSYFSLSFTSSFCIVTICTSCCTFLICSNPDPIFATSTIMAQIWV